MTKKVVTNDGKKGGWLVGKRHYDKDGKPLGGIKAVVTDASGKPVELEGGEVIINREASKKYWKELSKINQSAGNGVPIEPPTDAFDEDPAEDYENGGKIEFNANHIPNKWILNYAIKIKEEHPDVWALGGNIFGNQAFINLKRVAERGHWLDSEEWMYKKWRAFVARHKGDFRIQGVIAMLKWVDKVDKGWQYMKNLIEEEIKKREERESKKLMSSGNLSKIKLTKKMIQENALNNGWYLETIGGAGSSICTLYDKNGHEIKMSTNPTLKDRWIEYFTEINIKPLADTNKYSYKRLYKKMNDGGNLSKTPAPASERIKGSKFNAPGTAKDSKSGASIKFDDNTLASIKSLIDTHNEKYPSKKITLGVAKAVVRRGMGAYSGTHRPTITGGKPNSRTAWGLARFNAFIYKIINGKSKSGNYTQDDDLIEELGIKVSKFAKGGGIEKEIPVRVDYLEQQLFENNKDIQVPKSVYKDYSKSGKVPKDIVDDLSSEIDEKHWIETTTLSVHLTPLNKMAKGGLIAPNGKLSNLTPEQHKLVRTPAFKAWFGDWENDPKNASKVVDENGEPLVVYRGDSSASKKGFVFKTGYNRMSYISKDRLPNQYFHYFVDNYDVALGYGQNQIEDHNEKVAASGKGKLWEASVTPYFLSIKNPIDITPSNTLFPTFSQYEKLEQKIQGKEGFLQQKYRIGYDYGFYITEADLNRILENKLGKDYLENTKETEERYSYIDEWQKNSFRNSYYPEKTFAYFIEYKNSRSRSDILRRIYLKMLNKNVDGMVFLESTNWKTDFFENWRKYESGELKYDSKRWVEKPKVFAALESNQIKLADGTNIKFDSENSDIRFEEGGNVDAKDSVTIDIPLMIRLLELTREDVKSDAELHFVVENLLKLKNKPVLTMDDYAFIADVEHNHFKKYDLGGKMPESEKRVDLGFGGLGNGTTVWDRNRIQNNDYKIVAHISNEGNITYYDKKLPDYAINQIESMAENEKKRYEDMNGLSTGYDFNPIQTPLN